MMVQKRKGDLAGFKQCMWQEDIKPGVILWYVENRFHILFHLAAVLFHLQEKLHAVLS